MCILYRSNSFDLQCESNDWHEYKLQQLPEISKLKTHNSNKPRKVSIARKFLPQC